MPTENHDPRFRRLLSACSHSLTVSVRYSPRPFWSVCWTGRTRRTDRVTVHHCHCTKIDASLSPQWDQSGHSTTKMHLKCKQLTQANLISLCYCVLGGWHEFRSKDDRPWHALQAMWGANDFPPPSIGGQFVRAASQGAGRKRFSSSFNERPPAIAQTTVCATI